MSINLRQKAITMKSGTTYYVLRNTETEPVDIEDFYDEMTAESTVTRHDVKGVVSALQEWVIRYLKEGYSVRMGDLGSFRVTLKSNGQSNEDDVTANDIEAVRVQFTPSSIVKAAFQLGGSSQQVKFVRLNDDDDDEEDEEE